MSLGAMKQALVALEDAQIHHYALKHKETDALIFALRAAIEQAQKPETELETYKRLYELRGEALKRPCINCGHQPAKIKTMAQPEQEPVAWMYVNTDGECEQIEYETPPDDPSITALYTAPRQWQGLTEQEIKDCEKQAMVNGALPFEQRFFFARAIEAKLREKNT